MSGYISKDFIHYGCGLLLDPEVVWQAIPYSVKKNIKKAQRANIKIEKREGNEEDLHILKNMWYDPSDPNLPTKLNPDDIMYIAYLDDTAIACIVMLPVTNHLFLNNLAANSIGKEYRAQDYLLWYSVNQLQNSKYTYIDIGVSYRKNLYNFFKKWQTISYPVIFNKPNINYPIFLKPFEKVSNLDFSDSDIYSNSENQLKNILHNRNFTFVPNINIAKEICKNNNREAIECTYNLCSIDYDEWCIVDLTKIFSTQFGALIVNTYIDDTQLWNKYRSQDIFKREFVYKSINNELNNIAGLISQRNENYNYLKQYFINENIKEIIFKEDIKSAFYFSDDNNMRYSSKLTEFQIEHHYNAEANIVGLPIHQNLNKYQLDLMYAIYRGILNLCSEWIHTDYYSDIKS